MGEATLWYVTVFPQNIGAKSRIFLLMKTPKPNRKQLAGFSLIEMAVVILIASLLMSAGLSLLSVRLEAAKLDTTQKHQEAIKQALINYLGKYRRLPCPTTVANGGAPAPLPPCANYSGIVPYYELGLDRATVLDGWENFITYVVSPNPIATPLPAATPPWTTAWLYAYSTTSNASPYTTTPNSAFWPSTSTGGITVTNGTSTIANPAIATGAAVALISYGKNGYGAFNVKDATNTQPPVTNIDERQNANPMSGATPPTVVKRDTTDSTAGGGPFDDIVMVLSANDLTGPLITNGTLQSSAQAVLSQANDIVLGNIVATRFPCPDPSPGTCTAGYYYTIPVPTSASCSTGAVMCFPPNVTVWGMSYYAPWSTGAGATAITKTGGTPIDATNAFTNPTAYILTAGDGTQKIVSVIELRGLLSRGAGFN